MTLQLLPSLEAQETSRESPTVSVVLLSYNRPDYLWQAVASIRAQSYKNLELIVVDNPSPSSAEIAEAVAEYGDVRLIQSSVNSGYAGGMNRGIESAVGRYIYLTEDDIVLDKDCIRHLVEYVEERGSSGLVSPVMYNKTEGTIRCAGGDLALSAVYRRRTRGEGERDTGQFARPFNVTYIDGATMFARAELFRRLGGFREEYFMYVEAVEFCVRVSKAKETLTVIPQAKAFHFEPPTNANASPDFDFHRLKNLYSLYLLHAPARVLPEFFFRYALLGALRAFVGKGGGVSATLKALLWTATRTPSLLKERRAGSLSPRRASLEGCVRTGIEAAPSQLVEPVRDANATR